MDSALGCLSRSVQQDKKTRRTALEALVRESGRDRCANCGGADRIRVRLIVPESVGGRVVPQNAVLLCRACEMAAESASPASTEDRRLVNFWVSQRLYDAVQKYVGSGRGFRSQGALVRYLITKFVTDADRFDDLPQYQDQGSEVKINVWVGRDIYSRFKVLVDRRGMTVTASLRALLRMYDVEAGW